MSGEFEVQYFGVHSKTNKNAEKDKYVFYSLIPQNCYNNVKDSLLNITILPKAGIPGTEPEL